MPSPSFTVTTRADCPPERHRPAVVSLSTAFTERRVTLAPLGYVTAQLSGAAFEPVVYCRIPGLVRRFTVPAMSGRATKRCVFWYSASADGLVSVVRACPADPLAKRTRSFATRPCAAAVVTSWFASAESLTWTHAPPGYFWT